MENTKHITIVGLGNMGGAITSGLLEKGFPATGITAIDISPAAKELAARLSISLYNSPDELAARPDVILLAIKPQLMEKVAPLYKNLAEQGCVFVSIAAGTTTAKLKTYLGDTAKIIRVMPNTPAAIGKGISVLYATEDVSTTEKTLAETLMATTGDTAWLEDETLMDAVTAVSGSGPAYFFLMMEELARAGIQQGLPEDLAIKLAVTTAWGAGCLAKENFPGTLPDQLRKNVTSPGGTTEAGLTIFYENNFNDLLTKVITAATQRGMELG